MSGTKLSGSALRRTLAAVRPHLRPHGLLIAGGFVALLAEVVLRVAEPWPVKIVVDAVSVSLGAQLAGSGIPPASVGVVVGCGIALVGLVGLRAIAAYCSTVAFGLVGSKVATDLRARVFAHVQSLSLRYHAVASAGDTVQRLVGDIGRLQEVAVTAGLPLVGNVVTLVALTGVMLWLDPVLASVVVAAALAYLLSSRRSTREITVASRATRKGEGSLATTAAEVLGAIRVVQAYGLERRVAGAFADGNRRALTEGVKARRLAAALERRTDVLVGIATAVVLSVGGWRVLQGGMTPGDLVLFMLYLKIAMKPLRDMAKYTGRIARAAASGERVADLLDERPEVAERPDAVHLGRARGDLVLDHVTVHDGRGATVFDQLSLHVPAGQHVCLIGPSGGGKSTLAGLLMRTADPVTGSVRLDGTDVRDLTLASLRAQFAVVPQDSVLFAATVRENIRYGRLDATDAEVECAARLAQAHDFVEALPDGYDTWLGTRGGTISGGQRQRLAVARALLRDAPVVVLDEATTGLDPAARAAVAETFAGLVRGRTAVTITHDLAVAAGADRVLWIEGGGVREDGTPDELLGDPSTRAGQWAAQQRVEAGAPDASGPAHPDAHTPADPVAETATGTTRPMRALQETR